MCVHARRSTGVVKLHYECIESVTSRYMSISFTALGLRFLAGQVGLVFLAVHAFQPSGVRMQTPEITGVNKLVAHANVLQPNEPMPNGAQTVERRGRSAEP